jgi:glutamyl-tRNA reductase
LAKLNSFLRVADELLKQIKNPEERLSVNQLCIMKRFAVLGTSWRMAEAGSREKIKPDMDILSKEFAEAVVLLTCNRVEVYVADSKDSLRERLERFVDIEKPYFYSQRDALLHLFKVASGLDSQILGEDQILSQTKSAYLYAKERGATGKTLNISFQKALSVAKRVRAETGIAKGNLSISSVAVSIAERELKGLEGKRVITIGAGKTGELTLKILKKKETICFVVNRNFEKAEELAEKYGAIAIRDFREKISEADLLISQTSAPHYIVRKDDIPKREILLIDLAVPADIEPDVRSLPNVNLYTIDEIREAQSENLDFRKKEAEKALEIIEEEVEKWRF